jgi:predicted phosphate transport protein (TIGR00153 family)
MLLFKREKEVRKLVLRHLGEVNECLHESRNALEEYITGDMESARQRAGLVIEIETRADDLEQQIREALLDGAFLPHIRSDIYRLVESVDVIAGKGENVARFMCDQQPNIPEEFESELLEIFRLSLNCFLELHKALKAYFKPKGEVEALHEHVSRVCEFETEVDVKQSMLTRQIFSSSLDLGQKVHLQQLVREIGNIADLSEDASDELEFAAMKAIV